MCHASQDAGVAEAAVVALEARGFQCWIAPRDVAPGTEYAGAILAGISGSRVLLLVFSRWANDSPHVPREVERAVNRGMPIVPFRLDEVMPSGPLEYFISGAQWLDASTGPPEDSLPALVDAVAALVSPGTPDPEARAYSDEVRDVLVDVVFRYGTDLARDPRRLQALLRDMVGERRAEISALVVAAEEGVPDSLLQSSDVRGTMERLTERLQDYRALGESAARWAIEGWATALRLIAVPKGPETVPIEDGIETTPVVPEPPPAPDAPELPPAPTTTDGPGAQDDQPSDEAPETVSAPPPLEEHPADEEPAGAAHKDEELKDEPPGHPTERDGSQDLDPAPPSEAPVPGEPARPMLPPVPATAPPPPAGRKRGRVLAGAGLVAVLVAGGLGVASLLGDEETPPGSTAATTVTTTSPTTAAAGDGDDGLRGSSVVVYGTGSGTLGDAIEEALAAFAQSSGIDVSYSTVAGLEGEIYAMVAAGDQPDIVMLPQPGVITDLARQQALAAVPPEVAEGVATQWPATWMAFGGVDGQQFGIPTESTLKSLVWYKPDRFAELGYAVPQSWDELRALTERALSEGNTPWCIGIESGAATGWIFTDWVEDLTLRLVGAEFYDQWVAHEVPFNTPEMELIWSEILDIWMTPGAVYGGVGSITSTGWFENADLLANDLCLMHRQGSFFGAQFEGLEAQVDVFYFPSFENYRPVLVSGSVAAALRDAPEVWAVMEYLGSADYAEARQRAQTSPDSGLPSGFLTANTAVDVGLFQELEQSFLDILRFGEPARFDASDLMPPGVGAGAFWTEAVRAINGETSVPEALEAIESAWP